MDSTKNIGGENLESNIYFNLGTYSFIINNHDQLCIALEPEAASIHCQYLPNEKLTGSSEGFTMAGTGQQYMVIDLGGIVYFRMIYIES